MKNWLNRVEEIGNRALFVGDGPQVAAVANDLRDTIQQGVKDFPNWIFTDDERGTVADAVVKVRLAVGAQYFLECCETAGICRKPEDLGRKDDTPYFYCTDRNHANSKIDWDNVEADGIALSVNPGMIAYHLYDLYSTVAAQRLAESGRKDDIRAEIWQGVSGLVFTDATGAAFTDFAIEQVRDFLDGLCIGNYCGVCSGPAVVH
ncbi:hypothetical protein ACV0ZS_004928 [Escherichia coli]